MVVRADNFTLCYLGEDLRPWAARLDHVSDACRLVALVVEVQNHDVCFPGVYAWVRTEVFVDLLLQLTTDLPAAGVATLSSRAGRI